MFDVIAFDADDTLWHNEPYYVEAQNKFAELLSPYATAEIAHQKLLETEETNLSSYGYGIKSFTLSMIETAIELSEGEVSGIAVKEIINYAREMLAAPVHLVDGAEETVARLAKSHQLMVITKGDLLDQQSKLVRSAIGHHFQHVEVVSDKREETYRGVLDRYGIAPERLVMVGNSLRSDILPVLAIGGYAAHIPYPITWAHERPGTPSWGHDRLRKLDSLALLPALIETWRGR